MTRRGRTPRNFIPEPPSPRPPPGTFTLPVPTLRRHLQALIGNEAGLCLSDVGRYIGRPYHQVRALAFGERRMSETDQWLLTELFLQRGDEKAKENQPVAADVSRGTPKRQYQIDITAAGPRLRRA